MCGSDSTQTSAVGMIDFLLGQISLVHAVELCGISSPSLWSIHHDEHHSSVS